MSLISLPLEILQQIAGIVESEHRPSLCAFSLANTACHRAAVSLIFRQIQISVSRPEALRKDITSLIEALSRTESARHVRQISIKGVMRIKPPMTEEEFRRANYWNQPDRVQEILGTSVKCGLRGYVVYDEPVIVKSSDEDIAWAPVVNLLHAVPFPRDLIYGCESQFPPSLLEVLHQQHPKCRLHHLTFRFRTLLWGTPYPYEMELATSPSLYRVNVVCAWRDSDCDDDYNLEAVMDLASGLAPNLKEVSFEELWPVGCWHNDRRRREPWQGLPGITGNVGGSLTSWTWIGCDSMVRPQLSRKWRKNTDLAHLQHLTIGRHHEARNGVSGEVMEWIVDNQSFPQLKTLSVALTRDDYFTDKPNYLEQALSFFQTFRSLEELSVCGPIDARILETILFRNGQTLRKLTIHPDERWCPDNGRSSKKLQLQFTKHYLSQIVVLCPLLQELSVTVMRKESSAAEVELYQCFAQMTSLRSLFLKLDCSNWNTHEESDQEPISAHHIDDDDEIQAAGRRRRAALESCEAKRALINYAVDESLARSIWDTISQHKQGTPLQRLKLWTMGHDCHSNFFKIIVDEVSRSWLLECSPRDDQDDPIIRELGVRTREDRQAHWKGYERCGFDKGIEQLFRSIWPCKAESRDWRDDWSSVPLGI